MLQQSPIVVFIKIEPSGRCIETLDRGKELLFLASTGMTNEKAITNMKFENRICKHVGIRVSYAT